MRLIDADKVIADNAGIIDCEIDHPKYQDTLREIIDSAETVDAVEVVRCRECIYAVDFDCPAPLPTGYSCEKRHGTHTGNWYCADGERTDT